MPRSPLFLVGRWQKPLRGAIHRPEQIGGASMEQTDRSLDIDYGACKLEADAVVDGTANPIWSAVRGVRCIGPICQAWDAKSGHCKARAQKQ